MNKKNLLIISTFIIIISSLIMLHYIIRNKNFTQTYLQKKTIYAIENINHLINSENSLYFSSKKKQNKRILLLQIIKFHFFQKNYILVENIIKKNSFITEKNQSILNIFALYYLGLSYKELNKNKEAINIFYNILNSKWTFKQKQMIYEIVNLLKKIKLNNKAKLFFEQTK